MQCKRVTLKLLGLICTAGVCLGASFIWTGGGEGDDWELCDNWVATGLPQFCYPSTTGDDVTIPYTANGYSVDLTTEEIDDLTILASVEFGAAAMTPTLTVDSLTLSASSADITVEISGATISVP